MLILSIDEEIYDVLRHKSRSTLRLVESLEQANQHAMRGKRNESSICLVYYNKITLGIGTDQSLTFIFRGNRNILAPICA